MWPPARGHFWPKVYNLNKLGRGPLGDAKYQISKPSDFRQEDFFIFPYISLCKKCDRWGGSFLTQDQH